MHYNSAGLSGISRDDQRTVTQNDVGVLSGSENVFQVYEVDAKWHANPQQTGRDFNSGH